MNEYSKHEEKRLKTGLFVLFALIIIAFFVNLSKDEYKKAEGENFYKLHASFNRIDGVLIGDDVRLAGVDVGKVVAAKLSEDFSSVLTFEINSDVLVPEDSGASIFTNGLLGSKFIEIEPGGMEDYLVDGDYISYTQDALVIEELLDRIISIGKSKKNKSGEKSDEKVEKTNVDFDISDIDAMM
jgi:phospholipid/cholesterol/gamma-HCH transport system substrate-binding protein